MPTYASTSPVPIDLASGRVLAPGERFTEKGDLDEYDAALLKAGTLVEVAEKPKHDTAEAASARRAGKED